MRSSSLRGAYVDNKGVRWDTNDADFEGWMSKQSRWISEWRKRYFVLKGSKLFFSKNKFLAPHGMIDLVECRSAKSADSKSKKRNTVEINLKNESFLLFTDVEKERDDWIVQIGKAIIKHSSMYVDESDSI